jgi:hypothetical protein
MFTQYQKKALDDVCRLIFGQFSNTVGVAFLKLDCDCVKLVGVSSAGEATSPMMLVSGQAPVIDASSGEELTPACEACAQDDLGVFRIKNQGIIWNDGKVKLPAKLKQKIRLKVFQSKFEKVR